MIIKKKIHMSYSFDVISDNLNSPLTNLNRFHMISKAYHFHYSNSFVPALFPFQSF